MNNKMKALVKDKAGQGATIKYVDTPKLGPHDVLVKVLATAICGTDLHIYKWDTWAASRMKPPVVIGHEMSGIIVKVGSAVRNWQDGDYVSVESHSACGICYQCKTGQAHICKDYSILGVDFDGCFAEYVRIPESSLWGNEDKIPPEIACLQDPLGNAILATESEDTTGKDVMITGCGSIGLFAVGVARALGASRVFAVDINDYRLKIAEKMGSTSTINPARENLIENIMQKTDGNGVDIVVEMSGSEERLHDGLKIVKNGGRVSLLGIPESQIQLDLANEIIFKGVTLVGVTGREIFPTWYKASALINNNIIDISHVITHKMKLEEFEDAFKLVESGKCGKIILYPN